MKKQNKKAIVLLIGILIFLIVLIVIGCVIYFWLTGNFSGNIVPGDNSVLLPPPLPN